MGLLMEQNNRAFVTIFKSRKGFETINKKEKKECKDEKIKQLQKEVSKKRKTR